tara:strand:+ start:124 stop:660 length:537 start_codon:yes stop_codon:yes gene_type:complete
MAKGKNIENAPSDLNSALERDFNNFIRGALLDLSREQDPISPIDTGFFASSWTASTQRPRPDQAREDNPPWSEIEPSFRRRPADNALVEPRFINKIKFNFKLFSKVYIGNRSEYAASALGSTRSQIPQYVQEKIRPLINATFTEKKPRIGIGSKRLEGGKGIGPFADPDREFVDYTNL